MTHSLAVTDVAAQGVKIYVRWSDGVEQEFESLALAKDYARLGPEDKDTLRRLGLSRYFFVDPTGASPGLIEGKTITFSNESNNMVVVA